ncbi:hypothetical protein J132_05769 [Termitomyces sp. J132]|nr:hypothetical protein J132_05769 [Termitomyces sp. J132]
MRTLKDMVAALTIHWDRLTSQKQKAGISTTALQTQTNQLKPKLICINPNCKQSGHVIENCYWKGGGKEGQFPPNFQNRNKMSKSPVNNAATLNMPATNVVTSTMPQTSEQPQPQVTYTLSATATKDLEATGAYISKTKMVPTYANSGATDHFFVDRHVFTDYKELQNPIEGHAAPKGASFKIIG